LSQPGKLLLVVNPKAGFGRGAKVLAEIRQAFDARNIATDTLLTTHRGDASEQLAASRLGGYDGVVAAGGDGTVFEVLNGLYQHPREARLPLGVVPVGTGNAFARDLGLLPGEWRKAVAIIAAANLRRVDIGRVKTASEQFHFINIIGMGFVVRAGLTAQRLKRLGAVAYTLGTLWQTLQLKSYPLRIEIDGEVIGQDNVFVEISNTRYTGTSFLIAPGAAMDDGLLDVTLLQKLGRLRLLRLFPTVYSGRHVDYQEISVKRGKSIRILEPAGYLLAPDGEFRGTTPAEITCLHQDLTIFSP
jgi:diacylglycerol kinase (ATP)